MIAPTAAPPASTSAEQILEAEEVAKDILELVEDGLVEAALETAARHARVAEAVIGGALLLVGNNRVGFRCFAEFFLGFVL